MRLAKKNLTDQDSNPRPVFFLCLVICYEIIVITMIINDINESKRKNSGTVVFPGHQRDKSRYSGTVPAIPGRLATMKAHGDF